MQPKRIGDHTKILLDLGVDLADQRTGRGSAKWREVFHVGLFSFVLAAQQASPCLQRPSAIDTMNVPESGGGNKYAILFDKEAKRLRLNGAVPHDTTEEDHPMPTRRGGGGRQMEVLDLVSFAQRNQTLRRIAAAPPRGQPTDAHDPIAGVRANGLPSSAGLCPGAPKGGILAHGTGMELRASLASDGYMG